MWDLPTPSSTEAITKIIRVLFCATRLASVNLNQTFNRESNPMAIVLSMHNDIRKQIRIGVAMADSYVEWRYDRTSANYDKYIQLKNKMDDYQPDPQARF